MPQGQICSQQQGQEQSKYFNTQGTGGGKGAIFIYLPLVRHFQLVAQLPQQASSQSRTWLRSVLSPWMRWASESLNSVLLFGKVQLFIDKAGLLPVVRGQMQTGTGKSRERLSGD